MIPIVNLDHQDEHEVGALYLSPLIAGAAAGVSVSVSMYPLDTLKTRLQSPLGLKQAGGFKGLYAGVTTLALGSIPVNSLFFGSYEASKAIFEPLAPRHLNLVHICCASFCRGLTSLIRVPVEVAKQRKQIYVTCQHRTAISILADAYRQEGFYRGVYRGFLPTLLRDLPYSFIELPLWDFLKTNISNRTHKKPTGFQSGLCGLIAGGVAAALTTPFDLVKTRIMIAKPPSTLRVRTVIVDIYSKFGVKGLFAGVSLRMSIIMIGRFIFFGTYDETKTWYEQFIRSR